MITKWKGVHSMMTKTIPTRVSVQDIKKNKSSLSTATLYKENEEYMII
jgi:hypothetical protein